MQILFLTQILPYPPDAGPKVKTWHVLRALTGYGHSITLVSFVRPEEVQYIPAVEQICKSVHAVSIRRSRVSDIGYMLKSYLTKRPFLIERDNQRSMQDKVNQLVRENEFDFIHADQLTMVQFAIRAASISRGRKPKVIFDAHNAVWTIMERMKENARWFLKSFLAVEAVRVRQYEGELLRTVDHVFAVTEIDRNLLEEALHFSKAESNDHVSPITVIPIAVDTQQLRPVARQMYEFNILTMGTLYYPPNADGIRWFIQDVFPLVQRALPNVKLTVVGKNPPKDFLRVAEESNGHIILTGYVPELDPYFAASTMMVIPVRAGGGMRVRILEAFARAMPVVTTTVGLEGIEAELDSDVLVADSPEDFSRSVVELLTNKDLQNRLSVNGRRLAEQKYDWQVVLNRMDTVYRSIS